MCASCFVRQMLSAELQDRHSSNLEWIIVRSALQVTDWRLSESDFLLLTCVCWFSQIWLIVVEVVLEVVWQIIIKDILKLF